MSEGSRLAETHGKALALERLKLHMKTQRTEGEQMGQCQPG